MSRWAARPRTPFPLIVAFSVAVHKCQSLTKDRTVTKFDARDLPAGSGYIAASRVASPQGLLVLASVDRQRLYGPAPTEGACTCVFYVRCLGLTIRQG